MPVQNSCSLIHGIKSIYRQNPSNITDQIVFSLNFKFSNTAAYWQWYLIIWITWIKNTSVFNNRPATHLRYFGNSKIMLFWCENTFHFTTKAETAPIMPWIAVLSNRLKNKLIHKHIPTYSHFISDVPIKHSCCSQRSWHDV